MISSVVWLILIKIEVINPLHAPWLKYISALIVEVILDCIFLPKVLDKLDERRKGKC